MHLQLLISVFTWGIFISTTPTASAGASFPQPCICSPQIKQTQDEEKKQLTALRDLIKSSLQLDQKEVGRSHPDTPGQI